MNVLAIARLTLVEALTRRVVLAGGLVSAAFAALFTAAFWFVDARAEGPAGAVVSAFGSTFLTVLALYSVSFLAGLLAVVLAAGAIAGEIEAGTLHALLARPISRRRYVLGRWLGLAGLLSVYVAAMAGGLLAAARVVAGYGALNPAAVVALLILQALVLLSVGLLGSTVWSSLANGVVVLGLFALAWLSGVVGSVGRALDSGAMTTLATLVSVAVPSNVVWRAASYYAQSSLLLAVGDLGAIPFASASPPGGLLLAWAAVYPPLMIAAAGWALSRRDL